MAEIKAKILIDTSAALKAFDDVNKLSDIFIAKLNKIENKDISVEAKGIDKAIKEVDSLQKDIDKVPSKKVIDIETNADTKSQKELLKNLNDIVQSKKEELNNADLAYRISVKEVAVAENRKLNENEILNVKRRQLASAEQIKDTIENTYKITKEDGTIKFGIDIDDKSKEKILKQLENINVDIKVNSDAINKAENELQGITGSLNLDVTYDSNTITKIDSEIKSITDNVDVGIQTDLNAIDKAESKIKALPDKSTVVIEGDVDKLDSEIDKLKDSLKGLAESSGGGGFLESFAQGGMIGLGIAGATAGIEALGSALSSVVSGGMELNNAFKDLENKTKHFGYSSEQLKQSSYDAFVGGVGGSVAEASKIIGNAAITMKGVFDPKELTTFVVGAQALGNAFDKDVNEIVSKSEPFIRQFGLSGEKAFNLISLAMRDGQTAQDDMLDTLAEYSQLAVQAGFSAEGFVNALTIGTKEGIFNTDKIADALKETQIRLKAGDTQKALKDFNNIPAGLKNSIQSVEQLASAGQISIKQFMQTSSQEIEKSFQAGTISESMRTQLQIAISGTPAEDLGSELYTKIFSAEADPKAIENSAKKAGSQISAMTGKYTSFESIQKAFIGSFEMISGKIMTFVNEFITPIIGTLVNSFKGLYESVSPYINKVLSALQPIITYIRDEILFNVNQFFNVIKTVATPIFDILVRIFDRVKSAIQPIIDSFQNIIGSTQDIKSSFQNDLFAVLGDIGDIAVEVGSFLLEFIVIPFEAIAKLVKWVTGLFSDNNKAIKDTGNESKQAGGFIDKLRSAFHNLKLTIAGITSAFQEIKKVIAETYVAVLNFDFKKAFDILGSSADRVSDAFKKGIVDRQKIANEEAKKQTETTAKTFDELQKQLDDLATKSSKMTQEQLKEKKDAIATEIQLSVKNTEITKDNAKQFKIQLDAIGKKIVAQQEETKNQKTAFQIAKEQYELNKKFAEDDYKVYENDLKRNALIENRVLTEEENNKLIMKQLENTAKLTDKARDLFKVSGKIGNIQVGVSVGKDESKDKIQSEVNAIITGLDATDIELQTKVNLLVIKDIEAQIQNEITDVNNRVKNIAETVKLETTVEYGIKVGLTDFDTNISLLKNKLKNEISNLTGTLLFANEKQKTEIEVSIKTINETLLKLENDYTNTYKEIYLNGIEDRYIREKEISLFELDKKYESEVIKIGANEQKKNDLYVKYLNDRANVEANYLKQTMAFYDVIGETIVTSFLTSFQKLQIDVPPINTKAIDESKNKIKELETQLKSLNKTKSDGSLLSYEDLTSQANQIKKEIQDLTVVIESETQKQADLFGRLGDAILVSFTNSFNEIAKQSQTNFENLIKQHENYTKTVDVLNKRKAEIEFELQVADFENNVDNKNKLLEESTRVDDEILKKKTQSNESISQAYTQLALNVGASFGAILATGKATIGDLGLLMLDALDNMIPVIVAQIYGLYAASPNPVNIFGLGVPGIVAATAATLAFKGLVALAKAGIKGAEGGVIDLDNNYTKKPTKADTIPFMLAKGESVMTAKETKKHKNLFTAIRENRDLSEIFVNEYGLNVPNPNHKFVASSLKNMNTNINNNVNIDITGITLGLNNIADLQRQTNLKLNQLNKLDNATLVKGYSTNNINVTKKIVNEFKSNNYLG